MEDDSDERDDTKRRSRNLSEKKRRDQFNSLVNDLNTLISAPGRKMDKSTVLKSTIAFLRHHNEATNRSKVFEIQQDWKPSFLSNDEFTQLMLESMDGFIIVFGSRGPIFYTSDSITAQLGYLPCDLNKKTIFDLAYELDHENLLNVFVNHKPVIEPMQTDISSRNQITFFVHLKRGGIDERSSGNLYELVKFVGYFRNDANIESVGGGEDVIQNTETNLPRILQMPAAKELDKKLIFVGTGRLQMPQLLREITVTDPTRSEFTSKHSMEWKFLFLDHRAPPIIGYMPFEVLGTSGYDYYHFDDIDDIVACHEQLLHTGKGKTGFYRFLTKGQQWIWLQTDFCVSYNQYNSKPDYVVCTHRVVNYADVLKTQKKDYQDLLSFDEIKSPATVYKDLDSANSNVDAVTPVSTTTSSLSTTNISGNLLVDIMSNENSPTMEALWRNTLTPTDAGTSHATPVKSASRPASNYSNISSTGVSPSVKRKRYPYYRGNDSDSTSMSADSSTSRQSLMTHVSSGRQKYSSNLYQTNVNSSGSQQQHHTHPNSMATTTHNQHSQTPHSHQQQQFHQQQTFQGNNNSAVNMLPQHMEANLTGNTSCQFSQPIFPLRGSQIMAPTFIEPPQYLTAIPVQPVIAPFPLAPVISPLPNQSDMLSGPMIMTSTQSQLQEQLQRKHNELQKLIKQQQEELRIVSEQLLMARYSMLHPMMPVNYALPTTMDGNNRNYNYNGNCVQPQFNQYGFAMNTAEIQNHHDQQIILQHQQSLQQQMHQNHAQQQQTTQQLQHIEMQSHLINQQAQQQQQQPQPQPHQSQGLHHQQQHPQQQQQQQLLNIIRPSIDLDQLAQDELDAFLNLSPVHSVESSQSNLSNRNSVNNNYSVAHQNVNNTSNTNQPTTSNLNTLHTTPFTVNPVNSSEDSLLTYMQMTAESNSALNFSMAISDEGAESQNEDTKHLAHPTYRIGSGTTSVAPNRTANVAPPRKSSPAYFTANTFPKNSIAGQQNPNTNITSNISSETTTNPINSAANAADPTLTTDLNTILPYSITTEQPSENHIFNTTTHTTGNSQ